MTSERLYLATTNENGELERGQLPAGLRAIGLPLGGLGQSVNEVSSIESNKAGQKLVVLAVNFDVKTKSTVGSRYAGYQIENSEGHIVKRVLSPAFSKTEELYGICGFYGNSLASTSRTIQIPIDLMALPQGWKFTLITSLQSGDEFTIKRAYYEYVEEVATPGPISPGINAKALDTSITPAKAGEALRIHGMSFTFKTSAESGTREVGWEEKEESGATIAEVLSGPLAASTTYNVSAYPGAPSVVEGPNVTMPLPQFLLAAGYNFEGIIPFEKSGDVLSSYIVTYEYVAA